MNESLTLMPFMAAIITIIRFFVWGLIICVIIRSIKNAKTHLRTIVSDISGQAIGAGDYKHRRSSDRCSRNRNGNGSRCGDTSDRMERRPRRVAASGNIVQIHPAGAQI